MVRKIVKYGDPVLEQETEKVVEFGTEELNQLIADMWETMYAAKGVGLAAPQVGVTKQISVIDISVGEDESKKIVIINPEVIAKEGKQTGEEGVPQHSRVSRAGHASESGHGEGAECERRRHRDRW